MVQLKDEWGCEDLFYESKFQFLMVQLKDYGSVAERKLQLR